MPESHYENFPVASLLLPSRLREPVSAIYAFARSADDFADEGQLSPERRLALLAGYRQQLDALERGDPGGQPVFSRLRPVVAEYGLPLSLFHDLLDAFSQDVVKTRYGSFAELMDYCRRSANPVGRLLLRLFAADSPEHRIWSDAICSALQLINHWQDVAIDWRKDRIYLPAEDMARFNVSEQDVAQQNCDERWQALLQFELDRASDLMTMGAPLGRALPGRVGIEMRAIISGGLRIVDKIRAAGYDVFHHRPTLGPFDWIRVVAAAL